MDLITEYLTLLWENFPLEKFILLSVTIYFYLRWIEGGQFRKDHVKMDGKVVIITGANTGIGKETALDLARRNAKIYLACRDFKRCEAARLEIIEKTGNKQIFNRHLDLASLKSVKKFAEEFLNEEQQLDVLINNAGVLNLPHSLTPEGCEIHMQINHLGHFLLTHLLLEKLKKAPQGRIVNVSSIGYLTAKINKEDLHSQKPGNFGWLSYANSKLAQVLTTQRLAKELEGTNVTVNSLHPGSIITEAGRNLNWPIILIWIFKPFYRFLISKSVKSGAQTTICYAVDPDLATVSGQYFTDCKVVKFEKLWASAKNQETNDFIWEESLRLAEIPTNFSYK